MATSRGPSSPYWNRVIRMGSASSTSATAAGTPISNTARTAQSRVRLKSSSRSAARCAERLGNITVAMAMPNTPSGNSARRSE